MTKKNITLKQVTELLVEYGMIEKNEIKCLKSKGKYDILVIERQKGKNKNG